MSSRFAFPFVALTLTFLVSGTYVGVSSLAYASTDSYLSGIRVGTDKATYVCGDMVEASAVLYSGNLTAEGLPVSLQVTSPSGNIRASGSGYSDGYGIARFRLPLPTACEMGVYTVLATGQDGYGVVNAVDKFSVSPSNSHVALNFDKVWYGVGDSVGLTGRLVTDCNLTYVNGETVQLNVDTPDNASLVWASTRTVGRSFTSAFILPASASPGLYEVGVEAFDPCQSKVIYGNAFFSVISNGSTQPWSIGVGSDRSTYETGNPIELVGRVAGGPYFNCQLGLACTGNGTYPPIDVSIQIINANGTQVYSKTMNIGLPYYPPSYGFQDVFSGYVNDSYLPPGPYIVTAKVSTDGFPTVQTATLFRVVKSLGNFALSTTPSTLSMIASSSDSVTLTIDPVNASTSQVNLAVSWLGEIPSNVTTQLSPITNLTGTSWVSVLTISAGPSAPTGRVYNLTVTGSEISEPNVSHTVEIQVQFIDLFSEPSSVTSSQYT